MHVQHIDDVSTIRDACGQMETFLDLLGEGHNVTPFVDPDHAALDAMLAGAIPEQPTATTPAST